MYINDSLYFDIAIIAKNDPDTIYNDFLEYNDVLSFKLIEWTGTAGVLVECFLRVHDKEVRDLFLANNEVLIRIGSSPSECDRIRMEITESKQGNSDAQNSSYLVSFAGVLSLRQMYDRVCRSYKGNSLEVLKQVHQEYFGEDQTKYDIDPNLSIIEHTEDNKPMKWLRMFQQGHAFMRDVWLHMDLGEQSCPIVVIDKYSQLHVGDVNKAISEGPSCYFVNALSKDNKGRKEVVFLNNFSPKSYKFDANLQSGFGAIYNIKNIESGKETIQVFKAKPDLASSKEVETNENAGYKFITNKYQSRNVHKTYREAYNRNLNRLVQLSSFGGDVTVSGYVPDVDVLSTVYLECGDATYNGIYLVNTKVTSFGAGEALTTNFYLCRDGKNNIENSVLNNKKSKGSLLKALQGLLGNSIQKTLQTIRNLRRVLVMARQVIDGTFFLRCKQFLHTFKYNLLTSFNLFGVQLNFNNTLALMESLKSAGNALCNQLIDTYLPYPYNYVLHNYAVEKPSLKTLFSRLTFVFGPTNEISALIAEISGLISDLTSDASKLESDFRKEITVSGFVNSDYGTSSVLTEADKTIEPAGGDMNLQKQQDKINNIVSDFINNTSGADIPISQIELTESETLLPDEDLKNLLADKTVDDLTEKGYLVGVEDFKDILLGVKPMDFNTIDKINKNIGNMLYARYWGTFRNINDLTDFYIKNAFKDIYVTVPTTKIINASRGERVFMALPSSERDVTFFLNNKEVEMVKIENVNLGFYSASGFPILYTLYLSEEGFNSNSVILEVRKSRI